MQISGMVGMIIGITVGIILFISVMVPVIMDATDSSTGALKGNATWSTLVTVVGTLTVIAIAMIAVRNLANNRE